MAKKLDGDISVHSTDRHKFIEIGVAQEVTLKDLRKSARHTQEDLAVALDVGQDTISRLEKRSDMLLSTLRHYVESVGGELSLVVTFPNQPPMIIHPAGKKRKPAKKRHRNRVPAVPGKH